MTSFDWGREAEKATEQAGFERGVQAERDRWLTNGTSWIKAGRAERDAEVAAHLKSEIAKWDQILNDDRRRGYLDDSNIAKIGVRLAALTYTLEWLEKSGRLAAARKVIEGYDGEVVPPKPSNALYGHIEGNQTSPASTKE